MISEIKVPPVYEKDVRRAVQILKDAGCTHIFLFGSITSGKVTTRSDIDLAVRGCPKGKYFRVLGKLTREIDHPVDLVNLDTQISFAKHLEREHRLIQIA
ncbi:MAG: nucleotidyltransferase domain-containing protein [Chloroflexota bacterium]